MKKVLNKYSVHNFLVFFSLFTFSMIFAAEEQAQPVVKPEKPWYEMINLSGAIRIRPELKSNIGFRSGRENTSEFISQKAWVSLVANPVQNLKIGVTLQDSRIWGGETNSTNGLSTPFLSSGLREAYLDLGILADSQLHVTAGRQKIAFGEERLFGNLEWNNVGRSFDALKIKWETPINTLNVWSSLLQESNANDYPLVSAFQGKDEIYVSGVYDTLKIADFLFLDGYFANKSNINDSTSLRHNTVGARFTNKNQKGKTPNDMALDFSAEGAYQFGTKTNKEVSAYASSIAVGYTLNPGFKIRIGAEGDIASGDSDSTDSKIETFDNLFPTNHQFYGQADLISWQNMFGASGNVSLLFAKEFNVILAYWYFSRMVNTDSWYAVTGGSAKNDAYITDSNSKKSSSTFLAHEIDLTIKSELDKNFSLEGGYSLVLPGDAVIEAGKTELYHFAYLYALMKF